MSGPRQRPVLELSMINQDALVNVLGVTGRERRDLLPADGDSERTKASKQQRLTELLEAHLGTLDIVEIAVAIARGENLSGRLVGVDQAFYFRQDDARNIATFRARLNTDNSIILSGEVDRRRYPFASTREHLSRRPSMYMIATVVSHEGSDVRLRPVFIGWRHQRAERMPGLRGAWWRERRIYPQYIDQFSAADFSKAPNAAQLKGIAAMPEPDVKHALATILGQPFVEKDWGGERSDLRFDRLMVDGQVTSSSWLLKGGAGVKGAMYIRDLGARGDQIERLTTDASEVMVVQHARQITTPVINMLAAFANDMRNPRRFMVLDGADTAILFRDHNLL